MERRSCCNGIEYKYFGIPSRSYGPRLKKKAFRTRTDSQSFSRQFASETLEIAKTGERLFYAGGVAVAGQKRVGHEAGVDGAV